jgi:hypothetical protein
VTKLANLGFNRTTTRPDHEAGQNVNLKHATGIGQMVVAVKGQGIDHHAVRDRAISVIMAAAFVAVEYLHQITLSEETQ